MKNREFRGPHGRHPRDEFAFGGPGAAFGPSFGPSFGPGGRRPGRRRGRRGGDVRAAVLLLLTEAPAHGYDLISQIGQRSEGSWSPSPGSIYPVLQQLEDEGLIEFDRVDGRKTAHLTEAGQAYVAENHDSLAESWEEAQRQNTFSDERKAFVKALRGTMGAVQQVLASGSDEQVAAATTVVKDARKALYGILADDDE